MFLALYPVSVDAFLRLAAAFDARRTGRRRERLAVWPGVNLTAMQARLAANDTAAQSLRLSPLRRFALRCRCHRMGEYPTETFLPCYLHLLLSLWYATVTMKSSEAL